jgi:hypothetical protein
MVENTRPNNRIIIAVGLILLGGLFLLDIGLLWPLFILVPGLLILSAALYCGKAGAASMSIPGMIVTGTGTLLFLQNLTGYWNSWSYAWTLYGVFLGMGFMLMGQRLPDAGMHRLGQRFVQFSLLMFAVFAFFFEVIIGISGGLGTAGAAILILAGLYLLSKDTNGNRLREVIFNKNAPVKQKNKPKRAEEALFSGPVVYGSRAPSRLSDSDLDAVPADTPSRLER